MGILELTGYLFASIVGLTLGILGGGGSILTVPILVYLFGIDSIIASSYSLFVVGFTSAIGAISHYRQGNIRIQNALYFGMPSILGVVLARKYVLPVIPAHLISLQHFVLTKSMLVLLLFALLMIVSSLYMMKKPVDRELNLNSGTTRKKLVGQGVLIGLLTGILGAGGGFLIIPTLIYCSMTMKEAIGTSLFIMSMSAFIGFLSDVRMNVSIDYTFLFLFSGIAALGVVLGTYLSRHISSTRLKPAFGLFVLVTGLIILIKELAFY